MNLSVMLWTMLAVVCGSLITLTLAIPTIVLITRLMGQRIQQFNSLMLSQSATIEKMSENQTKQNQFSISQIERATHRATTMVLTDCVQPLLSQTEVLVNRLLTKTAWDASQADSSLVSREAVKSPDEYIPQNDEAEARRYEEFFNRVDASLEDTEQEMRDSGWTSLDNA